MEDKERSESAMGGTEAAAVSVKLPDNKEMDIKIWVSTILNQHNKIRNIFQRQK